MEMDPPPLSTTPPIPAAAQPPSIPTTVSSTTTTTNTNTNTNVNTKIRLMCSYGGHIIPRPHDKTLCYVGGVTRIIVIDRQTTLSELNSRITKITLNAKPFTIKYQLPNEDLDSLISITTDEDLENMIDEYDRILNSVSITDSGSGSSKYSNSNGVSNSKTWRIRLFLFSLKSELSSIESLIESTTRSEDWFFDALNGNIRESVTSVNCLLGLDDVVPKQDEDNLVKNDATCNINSNVNGNGISNGHDVHSVPGSPMLDTTSSFGSGTSLPSMKNLPPIRLHVEERKQEQKGGGGLGIEESFQQMSAGGGGGGGAGVSPPPAAVTVVPVVVGGGENVNRVPSDDERSDQGVQIGFKKVPQEQPQVQLQQHHHQVQLQQKPLNAVDLPSPGSVSSEGSNTNPLSWQRQVAYQEQIMQNNRNLVNPIDQNNRVQETEYIIPSTGQFDQHPPQFVHGSVQYMHPPQVPSYYPVYPPQPRHPHHAPPLEQQYVYYVPARPHQAYNVPVQQQSSYNESASSTPTNRTQTQTPPPPSYNPTMNVTVSKPEINSGVYRTGAPGPQYVTYSVPPTSSVTSGNYGYEYADPMHGQVYYAQRMAPQYQTMTSGPGMVLPGASPKVSAESIKQQNSILQP